MEEAYLQVTISSSVSLSICLECNMYFFFFKSTACFKFLWVNGNLKYCFWNGHKHEDYFMQQLASLLHLNLFALWQAAH